MRRLEYWMAVLFFMGVAAFPTSGQALPGWLAQNDHPKPPDFGIKDDGGVFSRDSGALKRISDQLRKLEADHGFRILLMVEPVLIGTVKCRRSYEAAGRAELSAIRFRTLS